MPVMDGITSAREIRKLEQIQKRDTHVDIYFVSGNYDSYQVAQQEELKSEKGALTRFMSKPVDMTKIKELVKKYPKQRSKDHVIRRSSARMTEGAYVNKNIVGLKTSKSDIGLNQSAGPLNNRIGYGNENTGSGKSQRVKKTLATMI